MTTMDNAEQFWTGGGPRDAAMLVTAARSMIVARRALEGPLPTELIHDPVLDILLALFIAAADGQSPTRTGIEQATTITAGVTHRWIAALEQQGLIATEGEQVMLSPTGHARMTAAIGAVIRSQVDMHGGG